MIATFCRWWMKQAFDIRQSSPGILYQLTDREKKRTRILFGSL